MFWFALGRAEALQKGCPLHLNTDWYELEEAKNRPFLLDRFPLASAPDVTIGPGGGGRIEDARFAQPVLFQPIQAQLRRDFAAHPQIPRSDRVGVHVRRGDYAYVRPDGALLIAEKRIRAAMAHFPGRRFSVFSDDPDWCEEHLGGAAVEVMAAADPVSDMQRLAACSDLIIANSTFSWWAAWLNPHPTKTVLYPRNWHDGAWPGLPDPKGQSRLIGQDWLAY